MAYKFNFRELNEITGRYGCEIELDENNIKDIYFLTDCNTHSGGDAEITEYLERSYPQDAILKWNDEYVNNLLDGCGAQIGEWDKIAETAYRLKIACRIYTNERSTYKRIIDILQSFYKNYGYFINYYFLKKTPSYPYEDRTFVSFEDIYISKVSADNGGTPCSHGSERRYLKDDGYCGLVPRLYKLGFTDLLNEALDGLVLPVLVHFDDFLNDRVTDVMEKLGIVYLQRDTITDICDYPVRNLLKRYAAENAVALTGGFEELLADFPLAYDNAREYFFKCRCSLNKIYNRKDANAEKFAGYNIGRQTLDGWTNEWIDGQISQNLTDGAMTEKLLYIVQNFSDIVNADNAKKMLNIYYGIESKIKDSIKRTLIYYAEINRFANTTRHYGLLYIVAKNGLCNYIDSLESEIIALLNEADRVEIKNCINAMYKEFDIRR